ncbi:nucleotide-diphospho-sugar transferase [Spirosoma sp. RP8]|uniref:Nucleotide-diphospho-sugar transferase n=1 Tax=Spirosoma liriopis TaxID=2937440 RepID=A0ABT0HRX2_9BACT|nr:nucleotide-diphospho-sugar transferase [Spirosoma liriopis]MCK8494892.1 nucleotide-diphospho-sugar transferase [Spirosoma liriopis]
MFEIPILLLIFNRPDTTQRTFDAIRAAKPQYLFVAGDGPRSEKPTDVVRCQAARAVIEQIDWPCTVKTLFRTENRGCGRGPAEAITWFFEQVEEGIILEDDCVPDPSFFPYCQSLLEKYRHDEQVYMITGTNALRKWGYQKCSYFFSYMAHSLGWATWRRAWNAFDYEMTGWDTSAGQQKVKNTLFNQAYFNHYQTEFSKYQATRPDDVWDFQWAFARWVNGGKTAVPAVNLVENIGFNADATHSFYENDLLANIPLYRMDLPLKAPAKKLDKLFDWYLFERFISQEKRTTFKRVTLKLIKILTASTV